jgi:DNA-binding transcriptional ArsR family regulator
LSKKGELFDDAECHGYDLHMKPLYHPHPDEMTVQGILYALSDPVRVEIFLRLVSAECTKNCSTFANVKSTPLPKSTLSQHFKILREAGLIRSERRGVELQNRARCEEIAKRFGAMVKAILDAYQTECKASARKRPKEVNGSRKRASTSRRS